MPIPIIVVGIIGAGAAAAALLRRKRHSAASTSTEHTSAASTSAEHASTETLPAYPAIVAMTPGQRGAVLAAAKQIGINPAALADVIQSESGWDTTAPHQATGTPRAGLNQITTGANMPGLKTAEAVWAVRSWPLERQLTEVVIPYFLRMKPALDWSALDLYKRNFLPADARRAMDFKLGEKDSSEPVTPKGSLTRGQVYSYNPGFDAQKKGYFTWADGIRSRSYAMRRSGFTDASIGSIEGAG
jgi:hypothetical protein